MQISKVWPFVPSTDSLVAAYLLRIRSDSDVKQKRAIKRGKIITCL